VLTSRFFDGSEPEIAPMLNVMRDNLRHLKWVLWGVAASMLLYLGSFFDWRGSAATGSDWAARIDGHAVPAEEFLQIARSQDERYRSLLGPQYDQMKKGLRLGSQSIDALVDRRLVLASAKALGLEATKEEVSRSILDSEEFKDAQGAFIGKDQYTAFVNQRVDGGVAAFERRLGEDIVTRKWLQLMTSPAQVDDREVESIWRQRNELGAVDYVFVASASVPFDAAVDDAAAAAWYAAHPAAYTRPEARRLAMIVIDRQAQLAKVKVSDDEVRRDYDGNRDQYQREEQRHARHVLLKVPTGAGEADVRAVRDLAGSVLARAQKGEDFAALARSLSQDTVSAAQGGDLGWFGRGTMVKPFEDAVFATAPGQFSPVVETPFGFHVIQVLEARPAGTTSFEEVKDSIRRRLELQRAQELAASEAKRIRDKITKASDVARVAAEEGLKVEEALYSGDDRLSSLGPSPAFSSAVPALPAGQVTAPVAIARGTAIVGCTEIVPPTLRPLAEVKNSVKTDVVNERARFSALDRARRIASAGSLPAGAAAAKLEVKSSGDLRPGFNLPGVGAAADLEKVLFAPGTAVGAKGAAMTSTGAVAYVVTRHEAFDAARFQADKDGLRDQVLEQRRNEMLRGILDALRNDHTIEINQPLVDGVNGATG
jgi:peptidyl-prolyl cis-trans isomerase D